MLLPIQEHPPVRKRPGQEPQPGIYPSQQPQSGRILTGTLATESETICIGKNAAGVRNRFLTGAALLRCRHSKNRASWSLAGTCSWLGHNTYYNQEHVPLKYRPSQEPQPRTVPTRNPNKESARSRNLLLCCDGSSKCSTVESARLLTLLSNQSEP